VERTVTVHRIEWEVAEEDRGGFPTFMLKEIYEQPERLRKIIALRCEGENPPSFEELTMPPSQLISFRRIVVQAAGTSWHAGLYGKYLFERYLRIPTDAEIASEFRYREPVLEQDTLVIAISQSGETADTLAGIRQARSRFVPVLSLCNVPGFNDDPRERRCPLPSRRSRNRCRFDEGLHSPTRSLVPSHPLHRSLEVASHSRDDQFPAG
jgi:glucosamine 6-phosphate synthetase-like amidotransferase/phosphosugar isomerase protein